MKALFLSSRPTSNHRFGESFGFEFPPPVIQNGWLHGRESTQPWDIERLSREIGEETWLSYSQRELSSTDAKKSIFKPILLAGLWPAGGFIELQMKTSNSLEEFPSGVLTIYAETPQRASGLMAELLAGYRHKIELRANRPLLSAFTLS